MGEFKPGELFLKGYYFNEISNGFTNFYVRVGNSYIEFMDLTNSLYDNASDEILDLIKKSLSVK